MGEFSCSAENYEKCKDELAAFRNVNRASARGPEYFRWRYRGRPNNAPPIIVAARDASGEIAGALSVIPHHYYVGNNLKRLGVLGDISVSEKYRGRGIAQKMFVCLPGLEAVRELEGCVVMPNKEALRPLEKSGWVTVTTLERHVKLLSTREMVARRSNRKISTLISPVLDMFLKLAAREPSLKERSGYTGDSAASFDGRFDDLWAAVDKDGMILGLRNSEYLTWRFADHPIEKYGVYTLSEGSRLRGYIVFHAVGAACHIDDFLCLGDGESWDYLLSYFIGCIRKSGMASKVVININHNNLTGVKLREFGFFKSPDILNFMVLQPGDGPGTLSEGNSWFITAGDKDV